MSEKLQLGIYRIKDEIIELKKGKYPLRINVDIPYLQSIFKTKGYKQQTLQPNLSNDFDILLYFKRNESHIRWKEFIGKIADNNAAIIKQNKTNNESYILIFKNNLSNKIYATTGGFAHTALQGIVEGDFGLEILSRLMKAEDKTLRSTKEKNLTGGILGEVKFFRNHYNLNENENFGNFYQELHSSLNKSLLIQTFGFTKIDIDSDCLCVAKNSFTIKKSIDFQQLLGIIIKCEDLINNTQPVVEINGVKKLTKAHKALIADLNNELDKSIIQCYNGSQSDISIELCHKDFDKYLYADKFIFKFKINGSSRVDEFDEPLSNIVKVIEKVRIEDSNLSDKKLVQLINKAHIYSVNNSGDNQTDDLLRNHFYTEVPFNGKNYFLSDSEWFEIKSSFTSKLNEQCQDFINSNTCNITLDVWNYPTEKENDFNSKHIGNKNFLVFDKFTPENIEACDILHWDAKNIYFIHVKAGFDNSMRDLSHQVNIAARRIKEDTKTGYKFIEKLYDSVKNSSGTTPYSIKAKSQLNNIKKNDLLYLMKNKNIVFVLAVKDSASSKRNLSKIEDFNSNIAKFSLHELVKTMRNLDVQFEICEI
ncbi:MAG: TIGR04141 family sporadically distributed protein [Crocinitomicaceae bacterium]|nr:TIGR04141 family sporadically distributed protein [Crocinitomicaceae bacterium]